MHRKLIQIEEINRRFDVPKVATVAAHPPRSVDQIENGGGGGLIVTSTVNDDVRSVVIVEPPIAKPEPLKEQRLPNVVQPKIMTPPTPRKLDESKLAARPSAAAIVETKPKIVEKPTVPHVAVEEKKAMVPPPRLSASLLAPPRLSASLLNPPTMKERVATPLPQAWEKHFPIDESQPIDVVVQHAVATGFQSIYWVQLAEHESECTKLLHGINRFIGEASKHCQPSEIALNRVYAVPFDDVFYRAVCLRPLNARNEANFRLVDYGNEIMVPLQQIRPPIPLMCNLNAFAFQIMLQNDQRSVDDGDQLRIKIETAAENGVYMAKVIEPVVVAEVVAATPPPPSPSPPPVVVESTPLAIEKLPIPLGKQVKLYAWETSDIGCGRAIVSVYDTDQIRFIQERLPAKLTEYCSTLSMKKYWPAIGETCLAIFEDDGQWYRAECTDRDETSEVVSLGFLDYGNTTTAHCQFVRPITDEIRTVAPVMVHNCIIAGELQREEFLFINLLIYFCLFIFQAFRRKCHLKWR